LELIKFLFKNNFGREEKEEKKTLGEGEKRKMLRLIKREVIF
jgi:hypothetical protein